MYNLPNDPRSFYKLADYVFPNLQKAEVLPPKRFNPNPVDYFKSALSYNYEYQDDGCNFDAIFDYGISRVRLVGKRAFCTPIDNRIVNRYFKDVPLVPISIPDLDEDLDPNAAWINITWNKEAYIDGARDVSQDFTGEAWKFDEINLELLEVKYPVYYEQFFTGIEIKIKITYRSREGQWRTALGNTADAAAFPWTIHSLNTEWIHTYRVWSKYHLNNDITYINRMPWGEYLLYAPHRADDPIMRVYIQFPKWLIEDRWGENGTNQYAVKLRSFYSDELIEFDATGTRDNRQFVAVSTPVRGYQITRYTDNPLLDFFGIYYDITWTQFRYKSDSYEVLAFQQDYKPSPTPPPPPQDEDEDEEEEMNCCEELKGLLALILKRIGALPASVPNSMARSGSGVRQIESLAEFISYSVVQTNAQIGAFPQEIKIQDADLAQEGDQQKIVKLPNIAESIAEMVGILLTLQSESNANLIATISAMIEAGSAKQSAIIASDYAAANAEFLGYKGKQVDKKVWYAFTPGEGRLAQMLKAKEVSVPSWENGDDKDFNDAIAPLLELAAMYRAQNFRNIGTSNTLDKLKSILTSGVNISEALDKLVKDTTPEPDPNTPPGTIKKSSWDEFVEQAETGFIAKPGITDNLHPYGRELERRPKIREFGADTSEEPNAEQ